MSEIEIVGPEYIAKLLGVSVSTIKIDVSRKPESLPPRLVIPGRRALRWVKADVAMWLDSFRPKEKVKLGRPSQASRQSL